MASITTQQIDSAAVPAKSVPQLSTNGAAHVYIAGGSSSSDATAANQVITNDLLDSINANSGGWNRTTINASGDTPVRTIAANGTVIFGGYECLYGQLTACTLTIRDSATSSASGGNLLCSPVDTTVAQSHIVPGGIICTAGIYVGCSGNPDDGFINILWK